MSHGMLDRPLPSNAVLTHFLQQVTDFLPNLVVAILILVAGFAVAGWIARLIGRGLGATTQVDATVRAPLIAAVRYLVIVFALIIALGQVGVQMTSLLAVLGAAGLAVGLALQGTLSNIAAGIMLLWLRPFRIGDYIETSSVSGYVREIGLFVCHIETFDGVFVFAPNSTLWNVWMRNHSRAGARLVAWSVTLPRTLAFDEVAGALHGIWPSAAETGLTAPVAYLDQLNGDNQVIVFRGVVMEGSITTIQRETPQRIRQAFLDRFGADGEPRAIQRLVPGDSDPARYVGDVAAPNAHPQVLAGAETRPAAEPAAH